MVSPPSIVHESLVVVVAVAWMERSGIQELFPELPSTFLHLCPSPVWAQPPQTDVTVKRRERPIGNAFDQAVLDRIVMDIVHMPLKIIFVVDGMFPVTPLPQVIFSFSSVSKKNASLPNGACKAALESLPAAREIVIPGRERPYRTQVIR